MSGAFGWSNSNNKTSDSSNNSTGYDYKSATSQYTAQPVKIVNIGQVTPTPPVIPRSITTPINNNYPEAKHKLVSTAANVVIIVMDVTGSMQDWPVEIFKRLPTLYIEACDYISSDDLEILFCAHGDAAKRDLHPIQVARFGKGQELDDILSSFYMKCAGGGNGKESHELMAYYLLKQVDTSSAQNVYTFFITDEPPFETIDKSLAFQHLGLQLESAYSETAIVFNALKTKMQLFGILCESGSYQSDPIIKQWKKYLGQENVIHLDDHRRVVDVLLGVMAKLNDQSELFTSNLTKRQKGTKYADVNVQTVQKSIALINSNVKLNEVIKVNKPLV